MDPECWVCGTVPPEDVGVVPQLAARGVAHCSVTLCRACLFRPEVQSLYFDAFNALFRLRVACLALRGVRVDAAPLAPVEAAPSVARSHLLARVEALEAFATAMQDGLARELALRDPDRRALWEVLPAGVREQWESFEAFETSPASPPSAFAPGLALRLLAGLRAAAHGRDGV